MAGHGVPVAAGLQGSHTHCKLAGLQYRRMDELVDHALVASLQSTQRTLCGFCDGDQLGLVCAVCRRGYHVELCRLHGIVRCESYFLCALCNIQAVFVAQAVLDTVSNNLASTTQIEDTDLAALQEIFGTKISPNIHAFVDGNHFIYRHAAQGYHTVNVTVYCHYFISLVKACDQELLTGLLCGITFKIALVAGITNIHNYVPLSVFLFTYVFESDFRRRNSASIK